MLDLGRDLVKKPAVVNSARFRCKPAIFTAADSASFTTGLSPYSLATIYGQEMSAFLPVEATLPWPTTLAGVQLEICDDECTLAQLIYVSREQVNFY